MYARKSIDRLLGLLSAVLLLALVGSCGDEPANTAGHETDQTVQLASGRSEGELEKLGREWDEAVQQTRKAAQEMIDQGVQLASEGSERTLETLGRGWDEAVEETHEAVEETHEAVEESEQSSEGFGRE